MAAPQTCIDFHQLNTRSFSKMEVILLEGILFNEICNAFTKCIQDAYQTYFKLIHLNKKEYNMVEGQLIRFLINDIVTSGEYTLAGIAYYTETPEEILYEVAMGSHNSPSLLLAKKIFSLHRSIKPDFYRELFGRILAKEGEALAA